MIVSNSGKLLKSAVTKSLREIQYKSKRSRKSKNVKVNLKQYFLK